MPKFLTFDAEQIARAIRVRFPMMEEALLRDVVTTAGQIVEHLHHGREARIAARGMDWRGRDAFAEIIAFSFNAESMNMSGNASGMMAVISEAVHSVYCQGQPEPPTEAPRDFPEPPSGRN